MSTIVRFQRYERVKNIFLLASRRCALIKGHMMLCKSLKKIKVTAERPAAQHQTWHQEHRSVDVEGVIGRLRGGGEFLP